MTSLVLQVLARLFVLTMVCGYHVFAWAVEDAIEGSPGCLETGEVSGRGPAVGRVICHLVRQEDGVEGVRAVPESLIRQCCQNRTLEAFTGSGRLALQPADDCYPIIDPDAAAGNGMVKDGYFHQVVEFEGAWASSAPSGDSGTAFSSAVGAVSSTAWSTGAKPRAAA